LFKTAAEAQMTRVISLDKSQIKLALRTLQIWLPP
jgi:hypothetical protein